MQLITISENETGQRFDKFLHKYMPEATNSFLYKMLRKKNITLNGKKATGNEKLEYNDTVELFFAQETLEKFRGSVVEKKESIEEYKEAYEILKHDFSIVYENKHVVIVNKHAGVLTQKAESDDISLNEGVIGYLLFTKAISEEELATFKPSVCNRLDRNTSGLVICGKSLLGLQTMSELIKSRMIGKFYRCIVAGKLEKEAHLNGFLYKDEVTNKVTVRPVETLGSTPIITNYKQIQRNEKLALLEVELVTGKTHQIRAHLASISCPILGDYKYGNGKENNRYKSKYGVEYQLLHSYRLVFPQMTGEFEEMSNLIVKANTPELYQVIMNE